MNAYFKIVFVFGLMLIKSKRPIENIAQLEPQRKRKIFVYSKIVENKLKHWSPRELDINFSPLNNAPEEGTEIKRF